MTSTCAPVREPTELEAAAEPIWAIGLAGARLWLCGQLTLDPLSGAGPVQRFGSPRRR